MQDLYERNHCWRLILVKKHPFYTFDQLDPATSFIYYTVLKEDLSRLHRALGLGTLGGSVRLDNGMEFGTEQALLTFPTSSPSQQETFSWLKCLDEIKHLLVEYSIGWTSTFENTIVTWSRVTGRILWSYPKESTWEIGRTNSLSWRCILQAS